MQILQTKMFVLPIMWASTKNIPEVYLIVELLLCVGHLGQARTSCGSKGVPDTRDVLANVYKTMRDADFDVICNGESMPCHKNILAGAYSVFDARIYGKQSE